mmetsp:Transcript_8597/g.27384  ORF Transcript_8597/g.27384 Transcript_8597/m.27384 type:complete len:253 (+) Transcript_8597:256-1014(+)
MDAQLPATYTPLQASKLALERLSRAVCAAGTFSLLPIQVTMQVFCSAFPYEKESDHGSDGKSLFIVFKLSVAVSSLSSSSAVSPERKKMPGMAEGTVRLSTVTVAVAIVSALALGPSSPFLTMFGLSTAPSRYTPCCLSAANCATSTFSVAAAHASMPCLPLGTISGSTIGTRPWRWQMTAYCARFCTHSVMARSEGRPLTGSICSTLRHLAKRAPWAYASAQRFSRSSMPLHHVSAWPSGPTAVPGIPLLS